ncbi:MAG: hypothetical protein JNM22_02815 [Saprospiraceae bacterium]|nr:hypothetical protein [Saprospiraceae bacterium]
MKKLMSLAEFEPGKISTHQACAINGGQNEKKVTQTSTSTVETTAQIGCTETATTTKTYYDDNTVCSTTVRTENCD